MALVDILGNLVNSTCSDDGGRWRQFILDHLMYLRKNSTLYAIDGTIVNRYRYDLAKFLKEYLKLQNDLAWIVLLMNGMANDFEFDSPGEFRIPTDALVLGLYHSYVTINNKTSN